MSKKKPCFKFYPSDWAGSKWVVYDATTSLLPRKPACYVIYLDGVMSYVGQTRDLSSRMSNHGIRAGYGNSVFTKWGQFKEVIIKARFGDKYGDWAMRELRLISRLQPSLNCVGSSKWRVVA